MCTWFIIFNISIILKQTQIRNIIVNIMTRQKFVVEDRMIYVAYIYSMTCTLTTQFHIHQVGELRYLYSFLRMWRPLIHFLCVLDVQIVPWDKCCHDWMHKRASGAIYRLFKDDIEWWGMGIWVDIDERDSFSNRAGIYRHDALGSHHEAKCLSNSDSDLLAWMMFYTCMYTWCTWWYTI